MPWGSCYEHHLSHSLTEQSLKAAGNIHRHMECLSRHSLYRNRILASIKM